MQPGDSASVLQGVAGPGSEIVLMNRIEKASLRPDMRKVTTCAVSKSMGHADLKSMEPYQHQELEPLRMVINQHNRRKSLVRFLVRF
jgi:hypothetical protein